MWLKRLPAKGNEDAGEQTDNELQNFHNRKRSRILTIEPFVLDTGNTPVEMLLG
jgi:hypothetical protein